MACRAKRHGKTHLTRVALPQINRSPLIFVTNVVSLSIVFYNRRTARLRHDTAPPHINGDCHETRQHRSSHTLGHRSGTGRNRPFSGRANISHTCDHDGRAVCSGRPHGCARAHGRHGHEQGSRPNGRHRKPPRRRRHRGRIGCGQSQARRLYAADPSQRHGDRAQPLPQTQLRSDDRFRVHRAGCRRTDDAPGQQEIPAQQH